MAKNGFNSFGNVFCVFGVLCVSVSGINEDGIAGWEDNKLGVGLTNFENVDFHGFFVVCKCTGNKCKENKEFHNDFFCMKKVILFGFCFLSLGFGDCEIRRVGKSDWESEKGTENNTFFFVLFSLTFLLFLFYI